MSADRSNSNRGCLAAVFGLAGLVLLGLGARALFDEFAALHHWPKAEALVLSSELAHAESRARRNTPVVVYWPVVKLKYSVDGKQYIGLAHYAAKSDIRSDWQTVVDDLRPGTRHRLPYNPNDPSDVRIGVRWNFANLAFAGFMIVPGALLGLLAMALLASRPGRRNADGA